MKNILLSLSLILLMIGCNSKSYTYTVQITKCNDRIDTISFLSSRDPIIRTYRQALPILDITNGWGKPIAINVCEFKILSKKL